jgi:8-oxo-dGTP pyrophosphatase MutT (NUDIX family)
LKVYQGRAIFDRANFNGHITASAFILNSTLDGMLLINHRKLNRWLQPGGHVDVTDGSLIEAARREAAEETGIEAAHLLPLTIHEADAIFCIDSHQIPANINKNEPAHTHHDLRYLFTCRQQVVINLNAKEATASKWVPLTELLNEATFSHVAAKIIKAVKPAIRAHL